MGGSLRSHAIRLAASMATGSDERQKLLTVIKAAGKVGPYIVFNGKLWVDNTGWEMNPKMGSWDRVRLVNQKTGLPRKTEVEITWGRPGELSVYQSHRKQPTYKWTDAGLYVPPVNPKEVKSLLREYSSSAKTRAKEIVDMATSEGLGADAAIGFAGEVLEDVNFHSLARNVGGQNEIKGLNPQKMGTSISWDVYEAAAIAWFVAGLVRNSRVKKVVEDGLLSALQEEKQEEARENVKRFA